MSGGTLVSQRLQQQTFEQEFTSNQQAAAEAQKKQGAEVEGKLCSIFLPITSLKAPAGNASDNPSRAFEQQLEAKLAEVAPALNCRK